MNDQLNAPSADPRKPWGDDDDATFLVSIGVGILGLLLTLAGIGMYVAATAADVGADSEFFQRRNWVLGGGAGLIVLAIGLSWDRLVRFLAQRRSVTALN